MVDLDFRLRIFFQSYDCCRNRIWLIGQSAWLATCLGPSTFGRSPAIRVFSLLFHLSAVATVLCFEWLLPLGFDKGFNIVILTKSILNVGFGIPMVAKAKVLGMAITVTLGKLHALVGCDTVLQLKGLSPFQRIKVPKPDVEATTGSVR